ncbi:MAG: AGE family epimerase/isomerase [Bacteroidales bacterium]|nr:AGE family epimerase/isomerase [Bacteroidales bacterium]
MDSIKTLLETNILPFWLKLRDPAGGFFGRVAGDGTLDATADRGAILNARILWTFSAAYRQLRKRSYLVAATEAKEYFIRHFIDHKYGGVYWSVDARGNKKDTKAQLYAQGFAIYALSEYYAASRDDEAKKAAVNIFRIVETYFADPANGGYLEALSRDFKPLSDMRLSEKDDNVDKTMNSHLHLLEGYASLYRIWPDPQLKERTAALLDLLRTRIFNARTGHLDLYFDADWAVRSRGISYGHDIETSWLALECAAALKDFDLVNRIKPVCKALYRGGMEGVRPDGSLVYEIREDGSLDDSRQWWVEAETVVGNLWAWKYLDVAEGADAAQKALEYIKTHLVDWKGGEWYWGCDADGLPDYAGDKAGFWKCPYHNGRMCLQLLRIFDC